MKCARAGLREIAIVGFAVAWLAACQGPTARDKPWRHVADAGAEVVSPSIAPVLAGEEARLRALA